ncbi:hypothetical protein THAOC_09894 [Thalassiosira oceanica]|uniref:Uncharacterized protein n=1 Tax=Thalassiosira oceanica TaxID=159749 RepID=K0SVA2_THAOC|nr:hypothetical protein THAOC_09894 [Thalassiosira oceanica]|eukprot:EJK68889.1 hypothetical protein THAOC_09894 [Thalassiosira oceanica]
MYFSSRAAPRMGFMPDHPKHPQDPAKQGIRSSSKHHATAPRGRPNRGRTTAPHAYAYAIYDIDTPISVYQHKNERRTAHERRVGTQLATLRYEAARKRAIGPSAFVETAKLERAVLATEKESEKLAQSRETRKARAAKLVKRCNQACNLLVMATYWGIAMVAVDGSRLSDASFESFDIVDSYNNRASSLWKGLFFPLSYNGLNYKIAQFGIDGDMRPSCVGALTVVWAARVTTGECVDIALKWRDATR